MGPTWKNLVSHILAVQSINNQLNIVSFRVGLSKTHFERIDMHSSRTLELTYHDFISKLGHFDMLQL